ncbi:MAG: peptidylprolyl isomerase [Alphaproteobacteria bacterium HGW-Alphaproteobacteria-1]|jgi:peptidyl-prolyl cis-trans isomerase C|nr:MAG: peptidylprolyl isomerase [Alphaproteobacteria bacterium HGW-Alphaproteobacteria-1]
MFRQFLSSVAVAAFTFGAPALAQDAPSRDTVLATVGGTEITLGHVLALRASLPEQYNQIPPEVLFKGVLDQLVQQTLLMQALDGEPSELAQLRLENERRAILAAEVITRVTGGAVTEEALQAAYEAEFADAEDETEYRAAHILVETEEEAAKLVAELEGGANFAALAQAHSVGPSGPSGGELGWFADGVMVPEFFDAVSALEVGQVSAPVQTQFGWHVIQLNETRIKERPTLDDVRLDLADEIQRQAFEAYLATLEAGTTIERAAGDAANPELINRLDLLEN